MENHIKLFQIMVTQLKSFIFSANGRGNHSVDRLVEKTLGESRRMRKKRKWLLMNNKSQQNQVRKPKKYQGDWAALPDLVLEQIFQYLPYKVMKFFTKNQNSNHIKWIGYPT